jgi:hypothetical protein
MSFSGDIEKWREKVRKRMDTAVRKVALDLATECIMRSPVLTGRFKGAWNVAVGAPNHGIADITDQDGGATIARAEAAVNHFAAGQTLYVSNALPYARRIEFGHSKQAPAGIVRLVAQRYRPIVEAVVRDIARLEP